MRKSILVIVIVLAVLAGAYLVADLATSLKLRHEMQAIKAAGYATTIAEIRPRITPDSREAARLIMAAYNSFLDAADRSSREVRDVRRADSLDYSDDPALFQHITDRYSASIALTLRAAEYSEVTFPFEYERGWAMSLDSIPLALHTSCQLLRADAKSCFAQGRPDHGLKELAAGIHLANGVKDNFAPMMVVREMELRDGFVLARKVAPGLNLEALAALDREVGAAEVRGKLAPMFQTEMALLQHDLLANSMLGLAPLRNEARALNMATTRHQIQLAARPWYESKSDWDRDSTRRQRDRGLGKAVALDGGPLCARMEELRAEKELTQLGFAVLRYRAQHGRLPETLEVAVGPGYGAVDPCSGKPYVYRPSASGFLLYSVGKDMKDDGGASPGDFGWQVKL
jgi:hypothetical protein